MSKNIKGITIELDGETKGLDKALKDVNKRTMDVNAELKEVEKLLKFNPGNTELLAQKQKLLAEQVENASEKLQKLKDAEKQVQDQFAKGDIKEKQYRDFQKEVIETESKLKNFEGKLKDSKKQFDKFGDNLKNAGKKIQGFGDKLKDVGGSVATNFSAPILGGLALVTKGTEEYREDLAKLETNAQLAGIGADVLSEAFLRLSGVSSETDSNVEALSNLMAAGLDEQGMLEALDALSGAVIKFPDTLKIEGLADGLQETLATGKPMGSFAELLERMGINTEDFAQGLENARVQSRETDYILQTLAKTGLADVNEAYRENNEELIESKESMYEFQEAIAELGETLEPIVTSITDQVTKMVGWFNELSPKGQEAVIMIAGIVTVLGFLLPLIGVGATLLGGMAIAAGALGIGLAPLLGIIALVVAAIMGIIAIGYLLIKHWDELVAGGQAIWSTFKTWIAKKIGEIVGDLIGGAVKMKDSFVEKTEEIQDAAMDIWNDITGFFDGIDLYESGKAIIQSAIDGILAMSSPITNAVENIVGLVRDYWPFSPAKRGPLSDIHKMDFAGPIGDSIDKAKSPLQRHMENLAGTVAGAIPSMAQTPSASMAGATGDTYNMNDLFRGANINVRSENDIKELGREFARQVRKPRVG